MMDFGKGMTIGPTSHQGEVKIPDAVHKNIALHNEVVNLTAQVKELKEQLESSKAGALRYQVKFDTLSELFDRVLNSLKQGRDY